MAPQRALPAGEPPGLTTAGAFSFRQGPHTCSGQPVRAPTSRRSRRGRRTPCGGPQPDSWQRKLIMLARFQLAGSRWSTSDIPQDPSSRSRRGGQTRVVGPHLQDGSRRNDFSHAFTTSMALIRRWAAGGAPPAAGTARLGDKQGAGGSAVVTGSSLTPGFHPSPLVGSRQEHAHR